MPDSADGGNKPGAKTRTVASKRKRSALSPVGLADLARSGLSKQTGLDNDMSSHPSAKQVEGFEACGLPGPVLAMPYRDLHGAPRLDVMDDGKEVQYTRLRFHEKNSVGKYIQQKGTQPHIYYPDDANHDFAAYAKDPSVDILLVEGEKKSIAGCDEGFATIGIGGVDAFLYNGELIEDFKDWDMKGRNVFVVFDSDIMTKERVLKAEKRLGFELGILGGVFHPVRLPSGPITPDHPTGEKWGIDDFFEIIRADGEDPGEVMDALLDETPGQTPDEVLEGPFDWLEEVEKDIPEVEWIIPDRIPMGYVQRCDGEPSIGKSFFWLQVAIHVALGVALFGFPVLQVPVILILAEDDRRIIIPRIRFILVSLGFGSFDEETGKFSLDREKLPDGLPLKFWCLETDNLALGHVTKTTLEVKLTPMYRKVVMFAQRFDRPPLIICDTIRDTSRFNDNDGDEANAALKQIYGQLHRDLDAAVIGISHPSKTSLQNDGVRTGGAVQNAASVRVVTELRLSEDQRLGEKGKKYLEWIVTKPFANSAEKPTTHLLLANGHFSKAPDPNPLDYKYIQSVVAAAMILLKRNGTRLVRKSGNGILSHKLHATIKTLLNLEVDGGVVEAQIEAMEALGIITWGDAKAAKIAGFMPGPHWEWQTEQQEEVLFASFGPETKIPGLTKERESKRKKKKDGKERKS